MYMHVSVMYAYSMYMHVSVMWSNFLDSLNPNYTTYFKYLSEGVVFNRVVAWEETNHRSLDILCVQIEHTAEEMNM